jgi:hypothetical protein
MRCYIAAVEQNEGHVFRGQRSDIPIENIIKAGT